MGRARYHGIVIGELLLEINTVRQNDEYIHCDVYLTCESLIQLGLTTSNAWQMRLVGTVNRADALDDTPRVVQRCCA